jgi:heme exporter protein D
MIPQFDHYGIYVWLVYGGAGVVLGILALVTIIHYARMIQDKKTQDK